MKTRKLNSDTKVGAWTEKTQKLENTEKIVTTESREGLRYMYKHSVGAVGIIVLNDH